MILIDTHCDTPSAIMRGRDVSQDCPGGHVDFPKLRKGGVDAAFFALYTPHGMEPDAATRYAMEMAATTLDAVEKEKSAAMAYSADDILANKAKGLTSVLLGMENGEPVQNSLPLLREFHRMGVRYMTLTHNGDNAIADAASEGRRWNGLSPFGVEVVREMNRIGMMIDMAHVSDKTFADCIALSSKPLVSTHSCCRALCPHRRNMSDRMIRDMADRGGVIQINFYPAFLSDQWERRLPGADDIAAHIDHAVMVGGVEHVGIGTDYDGIEVTPDGMEDISKIGMVFDCLRRKGYSSDKIELIAGANFLRVMRDNEA